MRSRHRRRSTGTRRQAFCRLLCPSARTDTCISHCVLLGKMTFKDSTGRWRNRCQRQNWLGAAETAGIGGWGEGVEAVRPLPSLPQAGGPASLGTGATGGVVKAWPPCPHLVRVEHLPLVVGARVAAVAGSVPKLAVEVAQCLSARLGCCCRSWGRLGLLLRLGRPLCSPGGRRRVWRRSRVCRRSSLLLDFLHQTPEGVRDGDLWLWPSSDGTRGCVWSWR